MTVLLAPGAPAGARSTGSASVRSAREVARWHRPLVVFAGAMAAWAAVSAVGLVADPRLLAGEPIWAKPLKFSVSLALYALTLAWMLSLVRRPRLRRVAWWAGTAGAAASALELAVISIQVVRGTASHFNVSTPLDSFLYLLMAAGVTVMYSATLVVGGALALFTTIPDRALAWAVRLGLVIAVAGLSVGFLMIIPTTAQLAAPGSGVSGSHSVGGDDPTGGLFFLGWNTVHGDLRVAHFVGMHALQVLPLTALALGAVAHHLTARTRLQAVLVVAGTYAALTLLTLWQALRGQSVVRPDALTLGVLGAVLLGAAAAGTAVVRRARWEGRAGHPVVPR